MTKPIGSILKNEEKKLNDIQREDKNCGSNIFQKVQELADENSWKSQAKPITHKNIDNWAYCAQVVYSEFFLLLFSKLFERTKMPRKNVAFLVGQTNNILTCNTHQIMASILLASDSSRHSAVSSPKTC